MLTHVHTRTLANTRAGNTTCRWVQGENTLYQNIKSGLSFPFFSVLITSLPSQSITCKVIVWLTFSLHPSSNQLPSPLSPPPPGVSLPRSLSLMHAHFLQGTSWKGVQQHSTLRYNHDHWSNSLLSIYTHIQFVRTLRGVSGEVFVWLDLSGTGPPRFSANASASTCICACANPIHFKMCFFSVLFRRIFPPIHRPFHTIAMRC